MNDRIKQMRNAVLAGDHKCRRTPFPLKEVAVFRDPSLSYSLRTAIRFEKICDLETPVVEKDARIALQRTMTAVPEVCSDEEMASLRERYFLHERGNVSNICPDYERLLASGLDGVLTSIEGKTGDLYDAIRIEIAALCAPPPRGRKVLRRRPAALPHPPLFHLGRGRIPRHRGTAGSVPLPLPCRRSCGRHPHRRGCAGACGGILHQLQEAARTTSPIGVCGISFVKNCPDSKIKKSHAQPLPSGYAESLLSKIAPIPNQEAARTTSPIGVCGISFVKNCPDSKIKKSHAQPLPSGYAGSLL